MALGSVERVLVLGIVVVIVAILGIAVWGATGDPPGAPVIAADGGATLGAPGGSPRLPQVKPQFQGSMPLPGATTPAPVAQGAAPGATGTQPDALAAGPAKTGAPSLVGDLNQWREARELEKAKLAANSGAAPAPLAGGPLAPGVVPGPAAAGTTTGPVAGTVPGAVPGAPVGAFPVPGPLTPNSVPLKSSATEPAPLASATTKPVAVEPKLTSYTIANGDSLWKIAVKQYGDSNIQEHVDAIVAANPSLDADNLKVGTKINLPPKQTSVNRLPAKEQAKLLDNGLYEVKKGDTLSSIAKKQLGDSNRWREIYDLNREHIADPSMLFTGTQLRLPKT